MPPLPPLPQLPYFNLNLPNIPYNRDIDIGGTKAKEHKMNTLVNYHLGTQHDNVGRIISDIDSFTNDQLETTHDYIQWLFPLREQSEYNPNAPVMDSYALAEFRKNRKLQHSLTISLHKMWDFYKETDHWLEANNHNHLRITRIIKCLALVGLNKEAESFYIDMKERAKDVATEETLTFWEKALKEK